jgi:NAD(P)-dependent dehydrogenase (short-subunit alcohol dehydrogenase family)
LASRSPSGCRAEGCTRIVIAGRDRAKGEAAAQEVGATFLPVDLEDTGAVIRLVDQAADAMGRVTALAERRGADRPGVDPRHDARPLGPDDDRQRALALLRDPARGAARHRGGARGGVVNILSMVVHCGQSFLAPYSASKAALANVTKNAAQALRRHRIRVNGINCGWMDTPGEDAIQRKYHGAGDDWLAKAEAAQPFGQPCEARACGASGRLPAWSRLGRDDRLDRRFRPECRRGLPGVMRGPS